MRHDRVAWEADKGMWQTAEIQHEVVHLYGWLATVADMQALDPKGRGWKTALKSEMVSGEVQRLITDRRKQMVRHVLMFGHAFICCERLELARCGMEHTWLMIKSEKTLQLV